MDVKAGQSTMLPEEAGSEPVIHNSVLIRTHEPRVAIPRWLVPLLLVVVVGAGAGFWVYVGAHPSPPLVNHAVAASEGPSYATAGG